jgi:aryl-alcohol dehydrogenase-like predicted oxidoreductase
MQTLLLGTAQWGMSYGVTNAAGRIPDLELAQVANLALSLGVNHLDTAPAYGDSETRIGNLDEHFRVQTKVSAASLRSSEVIEFVESSIRDLRQDSLWSVLVHDWGLLKLSEREMALEALGEMRSAGTVERIGVSAYDESDLDDVMTSRVRIDVVQMPVNAIDQRLKDSTSIKSLRTQGVKVQARSIFLQGVLLDTSRSTASSEHPDLLRLWNFLETQRFGPIEGCVGFIKSLAWVDEVVVGFATANQLNEFAKAWAAEIPDFDWSSVASTDLDLLDPRRWLGAAQ